MTHSPDTSSADVDRQYTELQAIYLKWHNGRRPLSGFINELKALLEQQTVAARIDEVDRFRAKFEKLGYPEELPEEVIDTLESVQSQILGAADERTEQLQTEVSQLGGEGDE